MTSNEKRKAVVLAALTRKGKNKYSQDSIKRYMVDSGFGDCSSTIRFWYKKIIGIDIGLNTEAQLKSKLGRVVELKITNGIPDESKMQLGDCLMFRGKNNSRYLGVGHIEMYIGDGKCFGHGSGIGGTIKDMNAYCLKRQNNKSTSLLKNTGLICIVRFIEDDKLDEPIKPIINKPVVKEPVKEIKPIISAPDTKHAYEYYIVKSGDSLSKIANVYNTTVDRIVKLNGINNPDSLSIGQKLLITTYELYTVVKGDYLTKISKKFLNNANRYKEIILLNNMKSSALKIGQVLKIPNK